jgi:hypothetical protein
MLRRQAFLLLRQPLETTPKNSRFCLKKVKKGRKNHLLVIKKSLQFGKPLFILKIKGGEEWGKVPLNSQTNPDF